MQKQKTGMRSFRIPVFGCQSGSGPAEPFAYVRLHLFKGDAQRRGELAVEQLFRQLHEFGVYLAELRPERSLSSFFARMDTTSPAMSEHS